MNTQSRNDEITELSSLTIAFASVLPMLGIVVYGFSIGWTALGAGALSVMLGLSAVYYLIARQMLKYRQRSMLRVRTRHVTEKSNLLR
jgi:hypothetical protein